MLVRLKCCVFYNSTPSGNSA